MNIQEKLTVVGRKRAISVLVNLAIAAGLSSAPAMAQPIETERADYPRSLEGLQLANWISRIGDSGQRPFIVIDKVESEVLVFDAQGELLGATPALLGIAPGDDATPGIGERSLSEIGPAEKTTPAGRYAARIGPAKGVKRVLWVDFETSIALHPVLTGSKAERRIQRLKSPTPEDNRITFGCINVPAPFFEEFVSPLFAQDGGIVYILPERKALGEVFPTFAEAQYLAALPQ